jgi:uncharacterized membrane-anchored protein
MSELVFDFTIKIENFLHFIIFFKVLMLTKEDAAVCIAFASQSIEMTLANALTNVLCVHKNLFLINFYISIVRNDLKTFE